jgi:hypothetical protein
MLPANAGDTAVEVTALLIHSSGEWISNSLTMPHKGDPHSIASGISYARRYLYSMVGVVADDDDDGNAAVGRTAPQAAPVAKPAPVAAKVTPSKPVVIAPVAKPAPVVAAPVVAPEAPIIGTVTGADYDADPTQTAKMPSVHPPFDDGPLSEEQVTGLRGAFVSLRYGSSAAQQKCREVCGKERDAMTSADGDTLLLALQAELAQRGQT